ncbi:hypothetical protein AN958_02655, partial [Leucoagaricus sp. SymC.cos]
SLQNTIFRQSFLITVIDEAHHMRNPGNKHLAILQLLQQAKIKLVMTATPLHTAPKDIASMGRLVGIPYFFTEPCFTQEKSDTSKLRKARKKDDEGEICATWSQSVLRLQGQCGGHFLRRELTSVNPEGKLLLALPDYREIIGLLTLTERETEIMKKHEEAVKAAAACATNARIATKEDPSDLWPMFDTLEEWESKKSTKMDVCARICGHYLQHDEVDDIYFEEGEAMFPDIIDDPTIPRKHRIIIYAEFPSMIPTLKKVLELYGVWSTIIHGGITFKERTMRIKELKNPNDETRVLIFSSVGSTGLNLAIADIVIFFVSAFHFLVVAISGC